MEEEEEEGKDEPKTEEREEEQEEEQEGGTCRKAQEGKAEIEGGIMVRWWRRG